jgi:hypothetical protein
MTSVGIMASGVASGAGFKTSLGTSTGTVSGNTLVITTTAAIAVGDLIVVRAAADHLSATTPTFTIVDAGNTYTAYVQTATNATAAAGVAGVIFVAKATTAIAAGNQLQITLSGSVSARCAYAESFTGFNNILRSAAVSGSGTDGAVSLTSGAVEPGDLVLGFAAIESNASAAVGDSDTLNGPWSTITTLFNTTGGTATNRVQAAGQHKVVNASGAQAWAITAPATDYVAGLVVLRGGTYGAEERLTIAGAPNNFATYEFGVRVQFAVAGVVPKIWYRRTDTTPATVTVRAWNAAGTKVAEQTHTTAIGFSTHDVVLATPLEVTAGEIMTFSIGATNAPYYGGSPLQTVTPTANVTFLDYRQDPLGTFPASVPTTANGYVSPVFQAAA